MTTPAHRVGKHIREGLFSVGGTFAIVVVASLIHAHWPF